MLSRLSLIAAFALLLSTAAFAAEEESAKKTIEVSLDAPAANYALKITHVYQTKEKLLVVANVLKRGDFGGDAITRISDKVEITAPDLKIETYVLGKTWNWKGKEPYIYTTEKELEKVLKEASAKLIWSQKKAKDKSK